MGAAAWGAGGASVSSLLTSLPASVSTTGVSRRECGDGSLQGEELGLGVEPCLGV